MSVRVEGLELLYEPPQPEVDGLELEVDTFPYNQTQSPYDSPVCSA